MDLVRKEGTCTPDTLSGGYHLTLGSGSKLQLRYKLKGETIVTSLDETVPNDKSWDVFVKVSITETDA